MNRRQLAGVMAAAPLALTAKARNSDPAQLLVDVRASEWNHDEGRAWKKVARATMELDVYLESGFVPRVGDEVAFKTPIMSAWGVIKTTHAIDELENIDCEFILAEVRRIEVHHYHDQELGGRFSSTHASLHVNGEDRSGCCHFVKVIETIREDPDRDPVALAYERHDLKRGRENLRDALDKLKKDQAVLLQDRADLTAEQQKLRG